MMHKWESVEKMVSEWETQDVGEQFEYKNFKYNLDEFDNLPPVIPRFAFFLQLHIKPMTEYLYELKNGQSIGSLRDETKDLVEGT